MRREFVGSAIVDAAIFKLSLPLLLSNDLRQRRCAAGEIGAAAVSCRDSVFAIR